LPNACSKYIPGVNEPTVKISSVSMQVVTDGAVQLGAMYVPLETPARERAKVSGTQPASLPARSNESAVPVIPAPLGSQFGSPAVPLASDTARNPDLELAAKTSGNVATVRPAEITTV
jgi:hypothetical protein